MKGAAWNTPQGSVHSAATCGPPDSIRPRAIPATAHVSHVWTLLRTAHALPLGLKPVQMSQAFLFASGLTVVDALQSCFWPDGAEDTGSTPCNASADVSPCCPSDHYCLDNWCCFGGTHFGNRPSGWSCTDSEAPEWQVPCYNRTCPLTVSLQAPASAVYVEATISSGGKQGHGSLLC